jgi:hypothetical protein
MLRYFVFVVSMAMSVFSPNAGAQDDQKRQVIELPLVAGWFDGQEVQYVTTDVSDPDAAVEMSANYVPRLANAITPPEPGKPGAVERIYRVANFTQGSVLPSIPSPTGAANRDRNYSPIWQVHLVRWADSAKPHLLRSEEEILSAEEKGLLTITRTNIVVNCPVIFARGSSLPGASIKTLPGGRP